jgi:hypothetical protein
MKFKFFLILLIGIINPCKGNNFKNTLKKTIVTHFNGNADQLTLRLSQKNREYKLDFPTIERKTDTEKVLRYHIDLSEQGSIEVIRRLTMSQRKDEGEVVEEITLIPSKTINTDLEIIRSFSLPTDSGKVEAVFPLNNGWAKTIPLDGKNLCVQWELGNMIREIPSERLGLPVVQVNVSKNMMAAICTDPYFSSLYELRKEKGLIKGTIRYRYAASIVPLAAGKKEVRNFGLWLANFKEGEPFGRSLDAFFCLMLPDVPAGPKWIHDIAMVGYDYLSDNGKGWELDVKELAKQLTLDQRHHVALCFHAWYDNLGGYCYDDTRKELKQEWVAMGRTRKVQFTQDEVRRRLKLAKDLGFRVLFYFADGMLQDSGADGYRPEWDFVDLEGKKISGWEGPDTWEKTFARNPAIPEVAKWYQDYLVALLKAYGPDLDGFVWDETFHMSLGAMTRTPNPAYCDQAMMKLMKSLTSIVRAADSEKVFLSSECQSNTGQNTPGYSIVSNGIYQDSWCLPQAWSYGLFPSWRNVIWSCNWNPFKEFEWTRWGVEHFGTPVAISNGWNDDCGPWEWNPEQREKILELFRQRLAQKERVRFLTVDPATIKFPARK